MTRRYDFDWLKVIGAMLVVIAHAAGVYSPAWPAFGNIQKSKLFTELLWNFNFWLMPLFMLLAGAGAWYALQRHSSRHYVRERLLHLGLPMVVLTLCFGIPAAYMSRSLLGEFSGSLFEFYLHFFDYFPAGTFHLWFLLYLVIYALVTLPLFRLLGSAAASNWMDRLVRACQIPGGLYLLALPFLVVLLALAGAGTVGKMGVPPNEWARFPMLLLMFILGYVLSSDGRFQVAIARQWVFALALAMVTSVVMFALAWPDDFGVDALPSGYSPQYAAFWFLFGINTWSWLITWLGFGQRFMNVHHPLVKPAAALSYPLYLLHPIVNLPALLLLAQWPLNPFVSFAITAVTVLCGTAALAIVLSRWPLVRGLLGMKGDSLQLKGSTVLAGNTPRRREQGWVSGQPAAPIALDSSSLHLFT